MVLPVSSKFLAAQSADANLPISQIQLVLGNYASSPAYGTTIAATSSDGSGNYPAAGAIDGDRTEINIGAASGADNNVGKSSWRSASAPTSISPQGLDFSFTQSRTVNRIKLYHLTGHGLKSFRFRYWSGSAWVVFAATSDIVVAGQTSISTTGTLDTIDFMDVVTTEIAIDIYDTQVAADKANVVELEVYRKIDITGRVKSLEIKRQRDYKLSNPLATSVSLVCVNDDRFFSFSHIPNSKEVAQGFVNAELSPNMRLLISLGFNYFSTQEMVQLFTGSVDRISVNSATREAVIEARDGMKALVNKIDYSKLKTTIDIGAAITYVLNRTNISTFETAIDQVGISVDYFFSDGIDQLSTIRDLAQASGDASFYFDESGIATFHYFTVATELSHIWTTKADWDAGVKSYVDSDTISGSLIYLFPGWNGSESGWTSSMIQGALSHDSNGLLFQDTGAAVVDGFAYRASAYGGVGTWHTKFQLDSSPDSVQDGFDVCLAQTVSVSGDNFIGNGYVVEAQLGPSAAFNQWWILFRVDGGVGTKLATAGIAYRITDTNVHDLKITRNSSGLTTVYLDGVQILQATDNTYTSMAYYGYQVSRHAPVSAGMHFYNVGFVAGYTGGTWTSPALDTGILTTAFERLVGTYSLNNGALTFFTRSSPDSITWDPWLSLNVDGSIASTARRYLQVQVQWILSADYSQTPELLDLTAFWVTGGGGHPKYPSVSSATYRFDSTMLDIQQELADNLGGDSSILNDVTAQAQPLVLTGTNSDTVWQGTIGTPPVAISGANPLGVSNGQTITLAPIIAGGMDTSQMGSSGAAAITFAGGATGSYSFTSIHPTRPVLVIQITHDGTITDLRLIGKRFSNTNYFQVQEVTDTTSIAKNGNRQQSIANSWIVSPSVALSIATALVAAYKNPISYIPSMKLRPQFSAQIGDRVTVVDDNTDLNADYLIVQLTHRLAISGDSSGDISTAVTLTKVP